MHASYLSLAVFAIAAGAAPSAPRPNGNPFNSFPFNPAAGAGNLHMTEPGNEPDFGNHLSIPQGNNSPAPPAVHPMAPQPASPTENEMTPTPKGHQWVVPSAPAPSMHPPPQLATSSNMPAHHHVMHPSSSSSFHATPSSTPTPSQPASGLDSLLQGLPLLSSFGLRR